GNRSTCGRGRGREVSGPVDRPIEGTTCRMQLSEWVDQSGGGKEGCDAQGHTGSVHRGGGGGGGGLVWSQGLAHTAEHGQGQGERERRTLRAERERERDHHRRRRWLPYIRRQSPPPPPPPPSRPTPTLFGYFSRSVAPYFPLLRSGRL